MSAVPPIRLRALAAFAGPMLAYTIGLSAWFVPAVSGGVVDVVLAVLLAVAASAVLVLTIPVRALADRIEAHIRPSLPSGRFHDAAADVTVALGDPGALLSRDSEVIDVVGLPTSRRDLVIVTTAAFDVMNRREVVALAAARFAALRDPWCRVATQGAFGWWSLRFVAPLGLLGLVGGAPALGVASLVVLAAAVLAPGWAEQARNRCVDLAAIERTVDPGGLAGAVRRVSGLGRRSDDLDIDPALTPVHPLLALPRLAGGEMTTNVGFDGKRRRHIIECLRLLEAAEMRVGMAAPVGSAPASGRDLRRQWSQVGRPLAID